LLETQEIAFARPEASFVGSFFAMDQLPKDRLPQIAVAGRSNVGKSSLLNHMLGHRKLARVSSTPGRTRSLNFFQVEKRFYVVDLPGYGYAKVSKSMRIEWGQLIEEYLTSCDNLIGLILLLDCRREPTAQDWELIGWLAERQLPVMVAITKSDKLNKDKLNRKVRELEEKLGGAVIPFSIVSGGGRKVLLSSLRELVDEHMQQKKAHPNG
jgi:GTP-binding protein